MTEQIISCAIHDYIEIACTFAYEVTLELHSGTQLTGVAVTTETSKDKKEYLLLSCTGEINRVELITIKKMNSVDPNPHFNQVNF